MTAPVSCQGTIYPHSHARGRSTSSSPFIFRWFADYGSLSPGAQILVSHATEVQFTRSQLPLHPLPPYLLALRTRLFNWISSLQMTSQELAANSLSVVRPQQTRTTF